MYYIGPYNLITRIDGVDSFKLQLEASELRKLAEQVRIELQCDGYIHRVWPLHRVEESLGTELNIAALFLDSSWKTVRMLYNNLHMYALASYLVLYRQGRVERACAHDRVFVNLASAESSVLHHESSVTIGDRLYEVGRLISSAGLYAELLCASMFLLNQHDETTLFLVGLDGSYATFTMAHNNLTSSVTEIHRHGTEQDIPLLGLSPFIKESGYIFDETGESLSSDCVCLYDIPVVTDGKFKCITHVGISFDAACQATSEVLGYLGRMPVPCCVCYNPKQTTFGTALGTIVDTLRQHAVDADHFVFDAMMGNGMMLLHFINEMLMDGQYCMFKAQGPTFFDYEHVDISADTDSDADDEMDDEAPTGFGIAEATEFKGPKQGPKQYLTDVAVYCFYKVAGRTYVTVLTFNKEAESLVDEHVVEVVVALLYELRVISNSPMLLPVRESESMARYYIRKMENKLKASSDVAIR